MKVAVLVKRVPDTASTFEIDASGRGVAEDRLKFILSPYDEHAVQAAIDLKAATGADVVAISLGGEASTEILRTALAMGADEAIHISVDDATLLGSRGVSEALAAALRETAPDVVFAGKQAVDDDGAQVPERIAELLGWPHASVITRFSLSGNMAQVDREVEGGYLSLEVPLPALFTTQKGINKPEYPKLPNIMKAKKKPLITKTLEELGLSGAALAARVQVESMTLPRQDRLMKLLDGGPEAQVSELLRILKEDEKAL